MRTGRLLAGCCLFFLSACATQEPVATLGYLEQIADEESRSVLRVVTNDVSMDGRYAHIRGTVENIGSERVEGIRYVVLFLSDDTPPRLLDTYRKQADTTLAPGERKALALDVDSTHNDRLGFNPATILATPVKLGGNDVPAPPQWK
ncbi:MAG: hypothetical protein ABI629_10595 [bacterium]